MNRRLISALLAGVLCASACLPALASTVAYDAIESYDPPLEAPPMESEAPVGTVTIPEIGIEEQVSDYTPSAMPVEEAVETADYDPENSPYDIAVPNVMVSVDISSDFSLAYVTENANIYGPDKKGVLFTLGKGDSLLVKDEGKNTLTVWTAVLVIDEGGDYLAYIRTSKLAKKNKTSLRVKDISKVAQYCVSLNANSSYRIYDQPSSNAAQIGTLRKAIVLPVLKVGGKFTAVMTGSGVGYIRNDYIAIVDNHPTDFANLPIPQEG